MPDLRSFAKKAFIDGLDVLGLNLLMRPVYAGRGVIFALHRVLPAGERTLVPGNAVSADFLDATLGWVRRAGWDLVGLHEACARLHDRRGGRFACFTFDDGFRDNFTEALPVFRAHGAPLCVFVCTGFVDRALGARVGAEAVRVSAHSHVLEWILSNRDSVEFETDGLRRSFTLRTHDDRARAYAELRALGWRAPAAFAQGVESLAAAAGVDVTRTLAYYFLDWAEARELARSPLVEIGAHSVSHRPLAGLTAEAARAEMSESRDRLVEELGADVAFFAYPYGGPECGPREFAMAAELGYRAALTSDRGNLFPAHLRRLYSLPRVTLSMVPHAASRRFVKAALSGSRNAIMNRFTRVSAR
jgi:peptidoglycan/xylan/chitin deacetylase (PgdA/CDA1 family)